MLLLPFPQLHPQSSFDTWLVFQSSCGLRHARKVSFSGLKTSQNKCVHYFFLHNFCCCKVFLPVSGGYEWSREVIQRAQLFFHGLWWVVGMSHCGFTSFVLGSSGGFWSQLWLKPHGRLSCGKDLAWRRFPWDYPQHEIPFFWNICAVPILSWAVFSICKGRVKNLGFMLF